MKMQQNANMANLKVRCVLSQHQERPRSRILFKIENTGPHPMDIRDIGISAGTEQNKRFCVVESSKGPRFPKVFNISKLAPISDESKGVLAAGQTCDLFVSRDFDGESVFQLRDFARSKEEAETIQFVVYAIEPPKDDIVYSVNMAYCEKFPVETEEVVIAEIIKSVKW